MNFEKTPVSQLQEIMQQRNITPHYQLLSEEGIGTHKPTFVVRVYADNMSGTGKGSSKKIAKQEAAKSFLEMLKLNKKSDVTQESTLESRKSCSGEDIVTSTSMMTKSFAFHSLDDNIRKKSVAVLQYYTIQMNLPSPVYEEVSVSGPAHECTFTYKCSVGSYSQEATGRTKHEARDKAALFMFEALKLNNFSIPETKEPEIEPIQKTEQKSSKFSPAIDHFYIIKNYMIAKNISYEDLWKDNLKNDYKTLESVLNILGVKYNLTFMTNDAKYIACLLLNIIPPFYLIELGDSVAETTNSVAIKMLFVLRVVTK